MSRERQYVSTANIVCVEESDDNCPVEGRAHLIPADGFQDNLTNEDVHFDTLSSSDGLRRTLRKTGGGEHSSIHSIEHGDGDWRSIPVCVRDTIARLLRGNGQPSNNKALNSSVGTTPRPRFPGTSGVRTLVPTGSAPLIPRKVSSSATPAGRGHINMRPPSVQPRMGVVQGPVQRKSFIPDDDPRAAKRSSSSSIPRLQQHDGQPRSSLSPTVARVLSKQGGSPCEKLMNSVAAAPTADSASPAKDHSNAPFGKFATHPYDVEDNSRAPNITATKVPAAPRVHSSDPFDEDAQSTACSAPFPATVSNRSRTPTKQRISQRRPLDTTNAVPHCYDGVEGDVLPVIKNLGQAAKFRSLATGNLITVHHSIDRMKGDIDRFLEAQLSMAMRYDPRSLAKVSKKALTNGPLSQDAAVLHAVGSGGVPPPQNQIAALSEVVRLMNALSEASVELVATFLSDEEKRYLGVNTHRFQTREEKEKRYQYGPTRGTSGSGIPSSREKDHPSHSKGSESTLEPTGVASSQKRCAVTDCQSQAAGTITVPSLLEVTPQKCEPTTKDATTPRPPQSAPPRYLSSNCIAHDRTSSIPLMSDGELSTHGSFEVRPSGLTSPPKVPRHPSPFKDNSKVNTVPVGVDGASVAPHVIDAQPAFSDGGRDLPAQPSSRSCAPTLLPKPTVVVASPAATIGFKQPTPAPLRSLSPTQKVTVLVPTPSVPAAVAVAHSAPEEPAITIDTSAGSTDVKQSRHPCSPSKSPMRALSNVAMSKPSWNSSTSLKSLSPNKRATTDELDPTATSVLVSSESIDLASREGSAIRRQQGRSSSMSEGRDQEAAGEITTGQKHEIEVRLLAKRTKSPAVLPGKQPHSSSGTTSKHHDGVNLGNTASSVTSATTISATRRKRLDLEHVKVIDSDEDSDEA